MAGRIKLFGAALDALDDPQRVALKLAWTNALAEGRISPLEPRDPYDELAPRLSAEYPDTFSCAGKLKLPDHLTPRPENHESESLKAELNRFYDDMSVGWGLAQDCTRFIEKKIFPAVPGMLAVDHSMTFGAYVACCKRHGFENVALIVLDSHFDAIPAELRAPAGISGKAFPLANSIHCGNFIAKLNEKNIAKIPQKNIVVLGPSDYPPDKTFAEPEAVGRYRDSYKKLLDAGITVIPKNKVRAAAFERDFQRLLDSLEVTHVYVSLDADVGSCACMNAVRFMDTVGLDEGKIMMIASIIAEKIKAGKFALAGFDISEIDVHLLGLEGPDGTQDRTSEICARFIKTLVGCEA